MLSINLKSIRQIQSYDVSNEVQDNLQCSVREFQWRGNSTDSVMTMLRRETGSLYTKGWGRTKEDRWETESNRVAIGLLVYGD